MARKSTKPVKKQEIIEDDDELLEDDELEDEELEEDEDELEEDDEDEDDELEDDDEEDEDDELEDDDEDEDEEEDELDEDDDEDELEEDDDEDEDDELDDDEDEDDELDDEDEDEEEEVPVKKSSKKAAPKKQVSKKTTSKKSSKASKAASKPAPSYKTFDDYYKQVTDKVARGIEIKENGGIMPSTAIANDLLYSLYATFEDEDGVNRVEQFIKKMAVKLGMDSDDVDVAMESLHISGNDAKLLVEQFLLTTEQIFRAGAGIKFIKNEDCNSTIYGKMTEEKIIDNSKLNVAKTRTHTVVDPYLKISVTGGAPLNKKHVGTLVKGKFVEDKPVAKKTASKKAAAPTKKTATKKTTKKK